MPHNGQHRRILYYSESSPQDSDDVSDDDVEYTLESEEPAVNRTIDSTSPMFKRRTVKKPPLDRLSSSTSNSVITSGSSTTTTNQQRYRNKFPDQPSTDSHGDTTTNRTPTEQHGKGFSDADLQNLWNLEMAKHGGGGGFQSQQNGGQQQWQQHDEDGRPPRPPLLKQWVPNIQPNEKMIKKLNKGKSTNNDTHDGHARHGRSRRMSRMFFGNRSASGRPASHSRHRGRK